MRLLISFLFLATTGCSIAPVHLMIYTQPLGGYVSEQETGLVAGVAPAWIKYDRKALAAHRDGDCYRVKGVEATWASGAKARSESIITLCGGGDTFNVTLARDPSSPGLDRDLQLAAQLQQANAQFQQASAQRAANAMALYSAFVARPPVAPVQPYVMPVPAPQPPINTLCTTAGVVTSCQSR